MPHVKKPSGGKVRKKAVPTISQVAAGAQVARSTVSRAFTRPDMLRGETVRRVQEVAAKLGYVPNQVARALSTGRHGNLALIVPDVANPFFPPLIRAAQLQAESADLCVFLGNSDENPSQEDKLVVRFASQVEGFVLVSSRLSDEQIREHAKRRPLVLINRDVPGLPRVLIDTTGGIRAAVVHLAELGHRRIAYVNGPTGSWSNRQRRNAFRQEARHQNVHVETIPPHKPTFEAGREAAAQILATGATAAVAFDDWVAQGVLAGMAEHGVAVPHEFSLIGCDDVLGAMTYPPLTTVSNRCTEAGHIAVGMLQDALQRGGRGDVRYVLDTHLVVRGSTARQATQAQAPRFPSRGRRSASRLEL
jgi:LacI family transcriptional regulator